MLRSLLALSLLACSGGSEPADGPDGAGSSPTPTETGTSPETGTVDTGWECNGWYPCQDCGAVTCLAEISSCSGQAQCGNALNSWASCVLACGDPEACATTFRNAGGPAAGALLDCVQSTCAAECGL